MSFYIDNYTLLNILFGVLVLLIVLVGILLRIRRKSEPQESIPGVEEMAKTTFFWSDYHRGKNRDDD